MSPTNPANSTLGHSPFSHFILILSHWQYFQILSSPTLHIWNFPWITTFFWKKKEAQLPCRYVSSHLHSLFHLSVTTIFRFRALMSFPVMSSSFKFDKAKFLPQLRPFFSVIMRILHLSRMGRSFPVISLFQDWEWLMRSSLEFLIICHSGVC